MTPAGQKEPPNNSFVLTAGDRKWDEPGLGLPATVRLVIARTIYEQA